MALLTLHINVYSNEDVWNTVMEQPRKSRKPVQFEFRQWQQMFLEVLETASVNTSFGNNQKCQPGRKFYHRHTVLPV